MIMPAATIYSYNPEAIHRLSELEFKICSYQGCACQARWIEEYLDLGLAHANSSPNAWQANSTQSYSQSSGQFIMALPVLRLFVSTLFCIKTAVSTAAVKKVLLV